MKSLKLIWLILFAICCIGTVSAQEQVSDCYKYGTEGFAGKKISLDFEEVELQKILTEITKQVGCEFVVDKSVGKPIFSMNLGNAPWFDALKSLLALENLGIQQAGPMFRVAKLDDLQKEINPSEGIKTKKIAEDLIRTEVIILKKNLYPDSMSKEELGKLISEKLSENGSYEIDDKENALKIVDLEKNLIAVRNLVTKLYVNLLDKEVTEQAKQKKP